ncbi:hypothetical protein BDW59DRAFT_148643 [Aspergillus cavernicola]|uniref:Uncharacterized protein n=1 Tax=Aspergillus cavernicola TaxID=176166 RepID=A0ABR4I6S7_9EURO
MLSTPSRLKSRPDPNPGLTSRSRHYRRRLQMTPAGMSGLRSITPNPGRCCACSVRCPSIERSLKEAGYQFRLRLLLLWSCAVGLGRGLCRALIAAPTTTAATKTVTTITTPTPTLTPALIACHNLGSTSQFTLATPRSRPPHQTPTQTSTPTRKSCRFYRNGHSLIPKTTL